MHFFAQISSSELKTSTQVRKYYVLRMFKQAGGAKIEVYPKEDGVSSQSPEGYEYPRRRFYGMLTRMQRAGQEW
jgi:5-methylcytosine-specific restriction endonuclease McrBC regulatory subunit McrC